MQVSIENWTNTGTNDPYDTLILRLFTSSDALKSQKTLTGLTSSTTFFTFTGLTASYKVLY